MTLIEYCITFALLSCIMIIGLSTNLSFYNSLSLPSSYHSIGRALETTRNNAFNQEHALLFERASLPPSSLSIVGPESLLFSSEGTIEDAQSYKVTFGSYQSEISITSNGIITY